MTFDLIRTPLTNIIHLATIVLNFLLFVVIQNVAKLRDGLLSGQWILRRLLCRGSQLLFRRTIRHRCQLGLPCREQAAQRRLVVILARTSTTRIPRIPCLSKRVHSLENFIALLDLPSGLDLLFQTFLTPAILKQVLTLFVAIPRRLRHLRLLHARLRTRQARPLRHGLVQLNFIQFRLLAVKTALLLGSSDFVYFIVFCCARMALFGLLPRGRRS